jgi:hypothetical protein
MEIIKNDLPICKKVVFLMIILFFILCIPMNRIEVLADEGGGTDPTGSPPTVQSSPSATLQSCLEWYKSNHPIPYPIYADQCSEIVGYRGFLTWTGIEGQKVEGCEPWQKCIIKATIGETTDQTIDLEKFELDSQGTSPLNDYVFSVSGFLRCIEPVLRVEPEEKAMDVGEWGTIKVYLDCGDWKMDHSEPVILEVVSGPGELELPELTPDEINRLCYLGYFLNQDDIIMTKPMIEFTVAEAELHATDVGTIEIKATYQSCREEANKRTITKTAIVHVGQWVRIDCTYKTDPDRFGTDDLQWGGEIHCEVCLEVYEDVQFGINVRALRGYASGTQECWVRAPDDYWIENKKCPAFTGEVIDGAIWDNRFDFVLDIDDSAALTFDLCYGERERPGRTSRHEWDPVVFMDTPIHLDANEDATYTYEGTDMLGTQYTIVARWQ